MFKCLHELGVCPEDTCLRGFSEQEKDTLANAAKYTVVDFDPGYINKNVVQAAYNELTIVMLDGTWYTIEATPDTKVSDLRVRAAKLVGKEKRYTKLTYGKREMKVRKERKNKERKKTRKKIVCIERNGERNEKEKKKKVNFLIFNF